MRLAHQKRSSTSGRRGRLAFTLVEVMVATALLGLMAGAALWALTQSNNYASVARLYTGAETAAQYQIDQFLSQSPFNPQLNEVPAVCTLSPPDQVENDIPIYTEPNGNGGTHSVLGTRTTTVSKVGNIRGIDYTLYYATVVVRYSYRGKNYQVQLNAMRSSDT